MWIISIIIVNFKDVGEQILDISAENLGNLLESDDLKYEAIFQSKNLIIYLKKQVFEFSL